MGSVAPSPNTVLGIGNEVQSLDPFGSTDSPAYFQTTQPMGISPSGTVLASATLGNLTLGTALDAIYGPTNNNCPGIWLYLPATALASPYNVAGFYWCVMSSTTVGTVYTSQPLNGAVQTGLAPTTSTVPATPLGPANVYQYPWTPPALIATGLTVATGTGSGYTGVTTAVPMFVAQFPGGTVYSTGSLQFNGLVSAFNSAGAKTLKPTLATNSLLTTGVTTLNTLSVTTGVSAAVVPVQILANGASNSWRYIATGSTPTFGSTDLSVTEYAGFVGQLATATDWMIAHLQNLTISQT